MSQQQPLASQPLSSFEELKNWTPGLYPWNRSRVPLSKQTSDPRGSLSKKQKLLVCHDMAGGYKDDRFVQGSSLSSSPQDSLIYHTQFWYLMDIFVYFSHSTITIPPVQWINASHKNQVQILGTVITEHLQEENYEMIYGPVKAEKRNDGFSRYYADKLGDFYKWKMYERKAYFH